MKRRLLTIQCRKDDSLPWVSIIEHTSVPVGEATGAWRVFKSILPRNSEYRMIDEDENVIRSLPKSGLPKTN